MAKSKTKTKTPSKKKAKIPGRDPQKRTPSGIFDNLRKLPHPVEEILGLTSAAQLQQTGRVSPTHQSEEIESISTSISTRIGSLRTQQWSRPY